MRPVLFDRVTAEVAYQKMKKGHPMDGLS